MKKETAKRGKSAEIEDLRTRLEEAEEALRAIRSGEVDALVVTGPQGEEVFTLKGAEQPYRVFIEAMNEGAVTLDFQGNILYCNNRFAEMLKASPDRVVSSSIYRFISPAETAVFEAAFQTSQREETKVDISLQTKDQEVLPVHLSFNALHGQDLPVVCVVAMDLTEHKRYEKEILKSHAELEMRVQERTAELAKSNAQLQAEVEERRTTEEALRESEERFELSMEATNDGLWDWNAVDDEVYYSPSYYRILGYEPGSFPGTLQAWKERVHPEDLDRAVLANMDCVEGRRESIAIEYRMRAKTGEWRWILGRGKCIARDAQGRAIRLIGTHVDITERKRAEEALREARDGLEKRVQERTSELSEAVDRLKGEITQRKRLEDTLRESEDRVRFFASQCLTAQETERKRVAGELHDSIAASLGAMKFRIEKIEDDMKQGLCGPEALRDLVSTVGEINDEVRRIMADLRPSILDDLGIIAAINWFCREYRKIYSHISVENQIGIPEDEVPDSLRTPIFRISQEAMNNIAKYSKASLVNLSLRKEDNQILLTIQDNGQGFDLHTVRKGLGLSTMRERANLSNGVCNIESARGVGTIIRCSWVLT